MLLLLYESVTWPYLVRKTFEKGKDLLGYMNLKASPRDQQDN